MCVCVCVCVWRGGVGGDIMRVECTCMYVCARACECMCICMHACLHGKHACGALGASMPLASSPHPGTSRERFQSSLVTCCLPCMHLQA